MGDDTKSVEANLVINNHMYLAAGSGAIPIPFFDLAAVTAVQLDMLKKLAAIYEMPFDAKATKSFITALSTALGGSILGRMGASAVKTIPGVGSVIGGAAQMGIGAATTYAVGHLFKRLFREGKPLQEITLETVKEEASLYFVKGKTLVEQIQNKSKHED